MPLLVGFVVFLFTWTLTTHGKYSATGDAPHYLIVAESLRSDRDLSLANNYRQNDGRLFGQRGLQMELHALPSRRGDVRSIHGLGLPVLILPVYTVAQAVAASASETLLTRFRMDRGLFAYSIVSLSLIAVTSVGMGVLAQGLARVTTRGLAAAIAIIVGISPPVVSHSFLVFPEVVALFMTCAVVWVTTRPSSAADPTIVRCLIAALGVLPWMHQKYVIHAAGLLVVIAWQRRDVMGRLSRRSMTGMALIFMVPQIALAGWLAYEWGSVGGALTTGALGAGMRTPERAATTRLRTTAPIITAPSATLEYIAAAARPTTSPQTVPFSAPTVSSFNSRRRVSRAARD